MGEADILRVQEIFSDVIVAEPVAAFAVRLARATRPGDEASSADTRRWLTWGAGPRACQSLLLGAKARALLDGRPSVSFEDIRGMARPVLRHRLVASFTAESEGITTDTVIAKILEDLPDVDAVIVPYGGGGLACGIATALRALRPEAKTLASEVDTSAAFAAALAAGEPTTISYTPSFVDGIGSSRVLDDMWPRAQALLDGSCVVSLDDIAAAVCLLVERSRVVSEGAGASSVAAALSGKAGTGKVVCVVSGGNIDRTTLSRILTAALSLTPPAASPRA
jgi:hypothetical protein